MPGNQLYSAADEARTPHLDVEEATPKSLRQLPMQTLPRLFFLFALIFASLLHRQGSAEVLRFKFFGNLIPVQHVPQPSPYGLPIPVPATVVGQFLYDSSSQPTPYTFTSCNSCSRYRQQIANGFIASIGGVTFRADDYIVDVGNNFPLSGDATADTLSLRFDSRYQTPPNGPFYAGGIPRQTGYFSMFFMGNSSAWNDPQLPENITLSDFPSQFHFLTDLIDQAGHQVEFAISTIKSCPMVPGDFDCNQAVNDSDLQQWKSAFGLTHDMTIDANSDGSVNAADYTLWRDHYHVNSAASFAASVGRVPEPSSNIILLSILIGGLPFRNFRRIFRRLAHAGQI